MNRQKAFTLMEMVVVVGIILILILIALLALNPRTSINKAYDSQRKKDLGALRIGFENYYSDYSCYPTQEQIQNCNSEDLSPYLREIPCDPVSTAPYELIAEPTICPQSFTIYAALRYDQGSSNQNPSIDDFNCFSVGSGDATGDSEHDCTIYFDGFVPSGTPTDPPTPPPNPVYYCSGLNNCTALPEGKTCEPSWEWPNNNCSNSCDNPDNICVPE